MKCTPENHPELWTVESPEGLPNQVHLSRDRAMADVENGWRVTGCELGKVEMFGLDGEGNQWVYGWYDANVIKTTYDLAPMGLHLATPEELYERFDIPSYVLDPGFPMWCNDTDVVDHSGDQWIAERRDGDTYLVGWSVSSPMNAMRDMQRQAEGARS